MQRSKNNLIRDFFIFFILAMPSTQGGELFSKKYPHGLLTPEYGILDEEADLGVDAWRGTAHPFQHWDFNGGYNYWQCFPTKQARVFYHTWRAAHPMGRSDVIVTMCSLHFRVETEESVHLYVGRRALAVEQCRDYAWQWKKITRNESYVCMNGIGLGTDEEHPLGVSKRPYFSCGWDRMKTKKGCFSYFDGYCDLKYWIAEGFRSKTKK